MKFKGSGSITKILCCDGLPLGGGSNRTGLFATMGVN